MKKLTKIFSSLLAVMMLLMSVNIGVFAEGTDSTPQYGSITIKETVPGAVFDIYQMLDVTYEKGEDGSGKYSYVVLDDWIEYMKDDGPNGGGQFVDTYESTSDGRLYISGFTSLGEENLKKAAKSALAYALRKNLSPVETVVNDTGEKNDLLVDEIPIGYYLVHPKGGTSGLCMLDTTDPDVEIEVKDTYPGITKEVSEDQVAIGDEIRYTIETQVPSTAGCDTYTWVVTDKMPDGLKVTGNVVVRMANNEAGTTWTNLQRGRDYTSYYIDKNGNEIATDHPDAGHSFKIEMDMTQWQDFVGHKVQIIYDVIVESSVALGGETNEAILEHGPDSDNLITEDTDETVYTYGFKIDKIDGSTIEDLENADPEELEAAKRLEGVEFVLNPSENTGVAARIEFNLVDGIYYACYNTDCPNHNNHTTTLTTDANGMITVRGLEKGTYYLTEISTLDGYNLLEDKVEIVISEETAVEENDFYYKTIVANYTGNKLPGTGGIGTTIFYIVGGILMLGALIILVARKKMSVVEK